VRIKLKQKLNKEIDRCKKKQTIEVEKQKNAKAIGSDPIDNNKSDSLSRFFKSLEISMTFDRNP
jgi:hypothetical protein